MQLTTIGTRPTCGICPVDTETGAAGTTVTDCITPTVVSGDTRDWIEMTSPDSGAEFDVRQLPAAAAAVCHVTSVHYQHHIRTDTAAAAAAVVAGTSVPSPVLHVGYLRMQSANRTNQLSMLTRR